MHKYLVCALLLGSWSAVAQDQDVDTKTGFLTGTQYRVLAVQERQKYVMGLLDGTFIAPFFDASKKQLVWLEKCATGMNDEQIAAILDRYLRDNPARWHESMNVLGFLAMKDACVLTEHRPIRPIHSTFRRRTRVMAGVGR